MKTQISKINFKKVSTMALVAMFGMSTVLVSCDKDNETPVEITEEDAYDVIEGSLVESSYGLSQTVEEASTTAEDLAVYTTDADIECGQLYTNTYSANGANFNYSEERSYKLICNNAEEPSSFEFDNTASGTYDVLRMSSDDNFTTELTVTGLEPSSDNAIVNGSYVRNGTQQSKVRYNRSFTSTVNYSLNNLQLNKSQHKIEGGTAVLNITLTADGVTKTYNANLTFNGDNTATLDINGNIYSINL